MTYTVSSGTLNTILYHTWASQTDVFVVDYTSNDVIHSDCSQILNTLSWLSHEVILVAVLLALKWYEPSVTAVYNKKFS